MGGMRANPYLQDLFSVATPAKRFRLIAVIEALTWAGLLVGMFLKHVTHTTELGVQVFGALHGGAFMLFIAVTAATAWSLRWNWRVIVLALLSSIPPLATVVFEVWAARRGHLAELSAAVEKGESVDARAQGQG